MRERDANKRNIPIIAKVRSKRKSPERGVETGLRHLQMPREKRQQRNNLLRPEQIVEHAAEGGHSRVEMVNKKQHLQNLDPTPTLADLLFARHSLFVRTYYGCCLLYFSHFDFSGEKFFSTSKLYGRDGKMGLTMYGIYPAPTLPDPLPC